MAKAKVGEPGRFISTDRYISGHIRHVVVDAIVPFEGGHRIQIGETRAGIADASLPRAEKSRQRSIDRDVRVVANCVSHTKRQLPAQHWRLERVSRHQELKIRTSLHI